MIDWAVVELAISGDRVALGSVLIGIEKFVRSVVSAVRGRSFDTDDIVQTVLMEVTIDIQKCKASTIQEFIGWVRVVSRNSALSMREMEKASKRDVGRTESLGEYSVKNRHEVSPIDNEIGRELMATIVQVANCQDDEMISDIIDLRMAGLTRQEIGQCLGVSGNSISGRMHRFRQKLYVTCENFRSEYFDESEDLATV